MPTVEMTEELAKALQHLMSGWAICKGYILPENLPGHPSIGTHGFSLCTPTAPSRVHSGSQIRISQATFDTLKKNKWIASRPLGQPIWWTSWFGRSVWVVSDAGKLVPIPPKRLWRTT